MDLVPILIMFGALGAGSKFTDFLMVALGGGGARLA